MYRHNSFWHYLGATFLAIMSIPALIGDTAYLMRTLNDVSVWLTRSNLLQVFTGYLNTFIHLIEFTFNNFAPIIIALVIWWLICKR